MAALGFEPRNTYVLSVYITNIFMIKYISLPKANGLTTIPHSPKNLDDIRYIYIFDIPEQKKTFYGNFFFVGSGIQIGEY